MPVSILDDWLHLVGKVDGILEDKCFVQITDVGYFWGRGQRENIAIQSFQFE